MDLSWIKYYPKGLMDKIIESSTGIYGGLLRMVAKVPDNNAIEYSDSKKSFCFLKHSSIVSPTKTAPSDHFTINL